ncbi:MAG: V-type ATP synthase subunit I, partial [Clostridia bacterium]|nr:V-type ATP synthase subunit I [Clostridia bacterium]
VARILFWGGLSTMVFGLLAGTCFGMNWYDIFGESFPFPLLDPMKDQMTAIIFYCALGFFQIIVGMVVSIVLHLKQGDWQTALFDIGSWLMIFAGAAVLLLVKGPVKYVGWGLLGLGLILLVGFGGRAKKGVGRVIGGLGKLYDITGFLSDVLSYSRVFALGLATGAMGSAFNLVAGIARDMLKGIPVVGGVVSFVIAAILLVVLHVFCVAINALGAFIHCARLQFIEYYNRFYTPGGKLYSPLGIDTKYNKVK